MHLSVITCEAIAGKEIEFAQFAEKVGLAVGDIPGVRSVEAFIADGGQVVAIVRVDSKEAYGTIFEDPDGPFHSLVKSLNLSETGRVVSTLCGNSIEQVSAERATVR